jgi:hypothetical protein
MDVVADQRVLLGIDVIGSARTPGSDYRLLSSAWQGIVQDSLTAAGITGSDLLEWEEQGDGVLVTLPHAHLGTAVDMSQRVHEHTVSYNRVRKPEIRLRMALVTGPVPDGQTYMRAKVDRARLLDAPAFKDLLARCHRESDGGAHTGLIISDHAFHTVFGGDHTELVRRSEFAELVVAAKEFRATAWVRVPGFDARSLRTFGAAMSGEESTTASDEARDARVHNTVNGTMSGVQANVIHGGITFGANRS